MLERKKEPKQLLKPINLKDQTNIDFTITFQPKSASNTNIQNHVRLSKNLPKCVSERGTQKNCLPPIPSSLVKSKITDFNSLITQESQKKGKIESVKASHKLNIEIHDKVKEHFTVKTPTFNESDDGIEHIEYLNNLSKAIKSRIFVYQFQGQEMNKEKSCKSIPKISSPVSKNSAMISSGSHRNIKEINEISQGFKGDRIKKGFPRHVFCPKIK